VFEGDDNSGEENEAEGSVTKSVVSAIKNPHVDTNTGKEKKILESKERHISHIKKEDRDVSNGHLEHIDANGTRGDKIEYSLPMKEEKLTAEENAGSQIKSEEPTEILGKSSVDVKQTIESNPENKTEDPKSR
jgi:hypothetical protein